jgi:hypothetical protein
MTPDAGHASEETGRRKARLAARIAELYATDAQFAAAWPDEAISAAVEDPGLSLGQIVQTVMEGYADRPAMGQRAVELVSDPDRAVPCPGRPGFVAVSGHVGIPVTHQRRHRRGRGAGGNSRQVLPH